MAVAAGICLIKKSTSWNFLNLLLTSFKTNQMELLVSLSQNALCLSIFFPLSCLTQYLKRTREIKKFLIVRYTVKNWFFHASLGSCIISKKKNVLNIIHLIGLKGSPLKNLSQLHRSINFCYLIPRHHTMLSLHTALFSFLQLFSIDWLAKRSLRSKNP